MKLLFVFFLILTQSIFAQDYQTHKVEQNETISSIAKRYMVTPYDIYRLNPEAKTKFNTNTILILPITKVNNKTEKVKKLIGYKKHRVRRKETLYSISKKYSITEKDIKKANKRLYYENLRKGDRIRIPRFKTIVSQQILTNTLKKYTVKPKEGKWRVAYKFGITVSQLELLNPNIKDVLQPDDVLNVPNIDNTEEEKISDTFDYYKVLPKEGFFRLENKLGLTKKELEALNPELKEIGLKVGMVLKIPKNKSGSTPKSNSNITSLVDNLSNFETKKLALIMPYNLNEIQLDSSKYIKSAIRTNKMLSAILDFHSGMIMALDSAKQLGISTELKVFDSQYSVSNLVSILNKNDFSKYDAVIGPLKQESIEVLAHRLKKNNVPLVIPMTKPNKLYGNTLQTIVKDQLLEQSIINFIAADSCKAKKVIITDHSHTTKVNILKETFPKAKVLYSRLDKKTGEDSYFIYELDVKKHLAQGITTVFLETNNNAFASSVISLLNGLVNAKTKITLVTTNKNKAFEDNIDNNHLTNLNFHYASVHKPITAEESKNGFIKHYKKTYNVFPNKYAIRGFDLTLDVLLRLAYKEDFFKALENNIETEYLENKFKYTKIPFGGYINTAHYVVKHEDLKVISAK